MGSHGARGRLWVAPYLALALVIAGIVVFAVKAQGYDTHKAELNDGGVWATNSTLGYYGRVNKPIGQLDGALFARTGANLDIVQEGAAVVGVDVSGGAISTIDPSTVAVPGGSTAQVAPGSQVEMHGGTLAVLDPQTGKVWAMRVNTTTGDPMVSALDSGTKPIATVGQGAALAVSASGLVFATSAGSDDLTTLTPHGGRFTRTTTRLAHRPGKDATLTAVGDRAVLLDPAASTLSVIGGGQARIGSDAVLQQPGPAASTVLVADGDSLLEVDLDSGKTETVAQDLQGSPAAPVRLGACEYGAWGGAAGLVVTRCGHDPVQVSQLGPGTTNSLVFRVNRGEILLNDATTGAIWNIDSNQPTRLDDWESFQKKVVQQKKNDQQQTQTQGDRSPPKAVPDQFGARPGRTTVLHPLDNDSAPAGRLLSISGVSNVQPAGATVTVSPDGQTVEIGLPNKASTTTFEYTINDGRQGVSAHATDTVTVRGDGQNQPPELRKGYKPQKWEVPAAGVLTIPVLPDWRDDADGDPLSLASAKVDSGPQGATARPTSSGEIRFTAPAKGGDVTVDYGVTDGIAQPVDQQITVHVQDPSARQAFPATAEPDVVVGQVGKAITVHPLDNDLPGSDPITPDASLKIAGKVTSTGGGTVATDVNAGTITFTSDQAKTYFLNYDAAFGNAPYSKGLVRVDVRAPDHTPKPPVAMPDSVTVYGQSAGLVDVLANDVDPSGQVLVVQSATATTTGQLNVSVVNGRWVRVSATRPDITPNPQVVHYTISDGTRSAQGDVVVTQRPEPADDTPVTQTDRVTVRAGSGTEVSVLDNDFSPDGDPLHLVSDVGTSSDGKAADAGALEVQGADDQSGPAGSAYVSGKTVRYNAPAQVTETETITVHYVAANTAGETAPGTLQVTVVPASHPNQPPEPTVLEGRVVAGDQIKLQLPGSGLDPDGDPVTLTGITSAPTLGRVLRAGADSLTYQAFPSSAGTDEFTYSVADPNGGTATGTVRVGVVPPVVPSAPVAVDDTATVAPGRKMTVDVLANDEVAAADRVTVSLVQPAPKGVKVDPQTGEMTFPAQSKADGHDVQVNYSISNGVASSQATVTLRTQAGYDNPPVIFDAYGTDPTGGANAARVSVDVLKGAYDPDGPTSALKVTSVQAPAGIAEQVSGGTVTIDRATRPMVVPFVVSDADGGVATAELYVPPRGDATPYVRSDAMITLDPGANAAEKLGDYVVNPAGGALGFTLKDRVWAAPASQVSATITGTDTFTVHAASDYQGPGSVSFEVSTGKATAILTVPVQVGATKPVLRCPNDPIPVAQGQKILLDVGAICHVWTATAGQSLSYAADWQTSASGLSIIDAQGSRVSVQAAASARPGTTARLKLTADGSDPGYLPITVVAVPPPTLAPISIADLKAGQTRTIDLAPYLHPGVPIPQPQIVSVQQTTALDVHASISGSKLTLSAGPKVNGKAQFHLVMSDVAGADPPPNRTVESTLELTLLAPPDAPNAPVPGKDVRDGEVQLSWNAPNANGSPITSYEVQGDHGAPTTTCPSTSCTITGLKNGTDYTFQVRAINAVGPSDWSPRSATANPDAVPYPVTGIVETSVGDGSVTLHWQPPINHNRTSSITYTVTYPGGSPITTSKTTATVAGLNNDNTYQFTIVAANAKGWTSQPAQSAPYQSVGAPGTPAAPTITTTPSANDDAVVKVSWNAVDANGPGPVRYRVIASPAADGGDCTQNPQGITGTSCTFRSIDYDGTTYSFKVEAMTPGVDGSVPGGQSRTVTGAPASWKAVGLPGAWGSWSIDPTGANDEVKVSDFTVPPSHGGVSTFKIYRGSSVVYSSPNPPNTVTVDTPDNDQAYDFHLAVCNENDACSQSSTKSVQSYGPLDSSDIVSIDEVDGDPWSVGWNVTIDSNGKSGVSVSVKTSDGDSLLDTTTSDANVQTFHIDPEYVGYSTDRSSTTQTVKVTISDGKRGTVAATKKSNAVAKPNVTLSQGAACTQDGADAACHSIDIAVQGYGSSGSWTCSLTDNTLSGSTLGIGSVSGKGDTSGPTDTGKTYDSPGNTINASCTGGATDSLTWPTPPS